MTLVRGKFVETPPIYEAIQWDGTAEGATELYRFILGQRPDAPYPSAIVFKTRVFEDGVVVDRSQLTFGQDVINDQEQSNRYMHEGMWLMYNTRTHRFSLMRDETLKTRVHPR